MTPNGSFLVQMGTLLVFRQQECSPPGIKRGIPLIIWLLQWRNHAAYDRVIYLLWMVCTCSAFISDISFRGYTQEAHCSAQWQALKMYPITQVVTREMTGHKLVIHSGQCTPRTLLWSEVTDWQLPAWCGAQLNVDTNYQIINRNIHTIFWLLFHQMNGYHLLG